MTLRPKAKHCDISLKAAFNWRHCFLSVLENDMTDKLSGIVELDETFFRESFKGQKKPLPRPARKRGNQSTVDTRDIPVLIAKDRQGGIRDGILPDLSTRSLALCLEGHIDPQAPVCMDAFLSQKAWLKGWD
ncbi:hypothetical protein BC355_18620 [Vibrio cholerae]|uniref:Transposase n=2 Tax=Vibrio cholerae TaxID=666 RepID=A0A395U448_VIBCL|nr:hypothetical protein [Vibrio cholerae]RGP91037.1 hypothetical protein BC354_19100 [Vibrio cholerae]RGP91360.1 hypothetical protein BC355_18620 [Vibrio cholerae]RGP91379.1 hypothetical protein BC353_18570 [Vibrio cholerae]RGP95678.1 hypothetical protein BC352_18655 [Vibrio cholerae]RJK84859.1 hypothetical protein CHN45_09005 [Vibrio cholerae]